MSFRFCPGACINAAPRGAKTKNNIEDGYPDNRNLNGGYKMKNEKTRKLAITALLVALTFLLGLTPIGYIPIPPVSMTLLCLPVIIGTIVEGLGAGLWVSLAFGVTSLFQALGITLVPSPLGTYLLELSVAKTLVVIFIPRLLIPVVTWLIYKAVTGESKRRKRVATGVAAFAGSITNTILFLGALYFLFIPEIDMLAAAFEATPDTFAGVLVGIGAINGLPEAVVAVLLCVPIVWGLMKYKNKGKQNN